MYLDYLTVNDLKAPYYDIACQIGITETYQIASMLQGFQIYFLKDLKNLSDNKKYEVLNKKIGKSKTDLLYKLFNNKNVYFPIFKASVNKDKLKSIITDMYYNGTEIFEIALEFGYTERTIYSLINN